MQTRSRQEHVDHHEGGTGQAYVVAEGDGRIRSDRVARSGDLANTVCRTAAE